MHESTLFLFIIKLSLGSIAAFLAIMLWSKTRDIAWMSFAAGTIIAYAGIIHDLLKTLGISNFNAIGSKITIYSVPLIDILFLGIPFLFYILALILILIRSK